MNLELRLVLNDLLLLYAFKNNKWAVKYYEKIIELLSISPDLFSLSNGELDKFIFEHMGSNTIVDYIYEYIYDGDIIDLKNNKDLPAIKELSKIYGVGPATCKKIIDMNIFTVADLRKSSINLTHAQQCGLKYYEDLNTRIPRNDITEIGEYIKSNINVNKFDIAGSYRRGAKTSGDIDILISSDDTLILNKFKQFISTDKIFVDFLSVGNQRITFLCKTNNLVKQVDILLVSIDEYAPALLYFTGSADFNVAMRHHAKTLGYKLNQNGLYDSKRIKINTPTEKSIFDALSLQYILPEYRLGINNINVIK